MRVLKAALLLLAVLAVSGRLVDAQTTTGTIRGHVEDAQGLALPGVTVTVTSANLQGTRAVVTAENGDFVIAALPSGTYTVTFELSGFERQQSTATVAPTQVLPVNAVLGVGGLTEDVTVSATSADVLTQTAQVATNFSRALIADLPTNRDINAYILMAPGVHPTGPSGSYSINGAMSFESLFLVNGVTVNENLRGQSNDLYIEDAIQETTVATAGISAEYGRFTGGVVNVITKSGGNDFSGSFRETMFNDSWRTLTPFESAQVAAGTSRSTLQIDKVVPQHEYTFGGRLIRDRLWFFTAGRIQTQSEGRQLVATNIPYVYQRPSRRYEGKGTYSLNSNHRFVGNYLNIVDTQNNHTFNRNTSMDLVSLVNRETPQDLLSLNYSGVLKSNLFVEATFSKRHFTFKYDGATTTDRIDGTLMIDNARGYRFWSPTFCGVCTFEQRDNEDLYGKLTYFLATDNGGSHTIVAGADSFNDIRVANNRQSGSDYRIYATGSEVRGTDIYPVILNDTSSFIQWNPIPILTQGSNFRTISAFVNDSWRVNARLTANLGLRWDKNNGRDQQGNLVAKDAAFSPRLGVVFDPVGDQKWTVTSSFAQYVTALNQGIGDSSSAAGNPQTFRFDYRGPTINADRTASNLVTTPVAIAQVLDWYEANGGSNLPFKSQPTVPGVSPQIRGNLRSPNVLEYAGGVSRQIGSRAAVRADYIFRHFRDFYVQRTDMSTGQVSNSLGNRFDLALIENSNVLKRRYSGLTSQATYRFQARTDIGATYTLSKTWGNFNGENVTGGPLSNDLVSYPEYRQASWNYPMGDLQIDQRHRTRMWVNYGVPKVRNLTVSVMQILETGTPFGANNVNNVNANGVNPSLYVTNPGYLTPLEGSNTNYYFASDCSNLPATFSQYDLGCTSGKQRDAFRLNGQKRMDFAANYTYPVRAGNRTLDLFFHLAVINLFDQSQLCGCGGTIFQNGGGVTQTTVDQTILTNVSTASLARFNPFTQTPVQGVNWNYGPNFGKPQSKLAFTTPRMLNFGFGVRF